MLLHPINKSAVADSDKWLILKREGTDWRVIEGQPTIEKARHAIDILENNDRMKGRKEQYSVRERLAYTVR